MIAFVLVVEEEEGKGAGGRSRRREPPWPPALASPLPTSQSHVMATWEGGGPVASGHQGFLYRPDGPNRRGPVPVYQSGSVGNRYKLDKFEFQTKTRSSNGSDRYTGPVRLIPGR
jgi:hypothetical protein